MTYTDNAGMLFTELTRPLREHKGNNDFWGSNKVVQDITQYFRYLRGNSDCKSRGDLWQLATLNRLHNLENAGNITGLSGDNIEQNANIGFLNFKLIDFRSNPNFKRKASSTATFTVDVSAISTSASSFNLVVPGISSGTEFITDNLSITGTGKLLINGNAASGFYNTGNAGAVPVAGSTLYTDICVASIAISGGGELALGATNGNKALITMQSGANIVIGSTGKTVLNNQSTLTIKSGTSITIKSAGQLTMNDYSKITIESGGKLIIETGGELSISSNANIVIESGGSIENSGKITASDNSLNASGQLLLKGGSICTIKAGGQLLLNNYSTITLNGTLINSGQLNLNNYAVLTAQSGSVFENGGQLIVGDNSVNSTGQAFFRTGSNLKIKNAGVLNIKNATKLLIETRAALVYERGAIIQLNGTSSILEVNGAIQVAANAIFTFTGTGFLRFGMSCSSNPYINVNCPDKIMLGTGATVRLTGTGINNKIIEVTDNKNILSHNAGEVKITNGKVVLGANSSISLNGGVHIESAKITSATSTKHKGLRLFGQQNQIYLYNITIENGDPGIYGELWHGDGEGYNDIGLTAGTITNCNTGIYLNGGGIVVQSSTFSNNTIGIESYNGTLPSYFYGTTFQNNQEGLSFNYSAVNAPLTLSGNTFQSNVYFGALSSGTMMVNAKCNSFINNPIGLMAGIGSTLNMSTLVYPGGMNNFVSNDISVATDLAWDLLLAEGYNNLEPRNPGIIGTGYAVKGTILYTGRNCTNPIPNPTVSQLVGDVSGRVPDQTIAAVHNHWSPAILGVQKSPTRANKDYDLEGVYCPVDILDLSPVAAAGTCSSGGCTNCFVAEGCQTCAKVNTRDFSNTPLDNAIKITIATAETDRKKSIELFHQLLTYDKYNNTNEEMHYLDIAYNKMQDVLGQLYYSADNSAVDLTTPTNIVLEVIDALLTKAIASNDNLRRYKLSIEHAQVYRMAGDRINALAVLNAMDTWMPSPDDAYQAYWKCVIRSEQAVLSGATTSLETCMYSSLAAPLIYGTKNAEVSELQLSVYPNPQGTEMSVIDVLSPNDGKADINLQDISGRNILTIASGKLLNKGLNKFSYNSAQLEPGVYIIRVQMNDKQLTEKIVVIK